jgi:hypothetical protein
VALEGVQLLLWSNLLGRFHSAGSRVGDCAFDLLPLMLALVGMVTTSLARLEEKTPAIALHLNNTDVAANALLVSCWAILQYFRRSLYGNRYRRNLTHSTFDPAIGEVIGILAFSILLWHLLLVTLALLKFNLPLLMPVPFVGFEYWFLAGFPLLLFHATEGRQL